MELDELKILLRSKEDLQAEKSPEEIGELLGKKTRSVLGKIRRSVWIELITCIFFTIALLLVAVLTNYSSIKIYFFIFSFLSLVFIPVLWFLLKKLSRLNAEILPVKTNLEEILIILRQYVKIYFRLTMVLIPIAVLLSLWLGYHDSRLNAGGLDDNSFTMSSQTILFTLIYLILFSAAMYYFTRWYLKKLYGNYLEQLKGLINELEE